MAALIERMKAAERQAQQLRDHLLAGEAEHVAGQAADLGTVLFATASTGLAPRPLAELVRDRLPRERLGVVAVAAPEGFVVAANEAAQARRVSAAALVRTVLNRRALATVVAKWLLGWCHTLVVFRLRAA
ncbi:hypothetical protein AB0C28_56115 [Nonomuraea sp. NPDC048892]|uniref:hypothetical protein n=1 Tax=Nonomuraea sp. NPDC048892 TaxID=3154624 RepID=UPI0033FC0DB0